MRICNPLLPDCNYSKGSNVKCLEQSEWWHWAVYYHTITLKCLPSIIFDISNLPPIIQYERILHGTFLTFSSNCWTCHNDVSTNTSWRTWVIVYSWFIHYSQWFVTKLTKKVHDFQSYSNNAKFAALSSLLFPRKNQMSSLKLKRSICAQIILTSLGYLKEVQT